MGEGAALEGLAVEFALAFQPLDNALRSPDALRDFLAQLGWEFPTAPAAIAALRAPVTAVSALAEDSTDDTLGDIGTLIDAIRSVFAAVDGLKTGAGLPADFAAEFPRQLIDYLIVTYLLGNQARWAEILRTLGIIRLEQRPADAGRPAYLEHTIAFADLGTFFADPISFVANRYEWGQSSFVGDKLLEHITALFRAWGVETWYGSFPQATIAELAADAIAPDQAYDAALELVIIENELALAELSAGLVLYILPETTVDTPGLALIPYATGDASTSFPITEDLELVVDASVELMGGVGLTLRPTAGIELSLGLDGGTPSQIEGKLSTGLRYGAASGPTILLGSEDASRLEIASAALVAGSRFHSSMGANAFVELSLQQAKLVVKPEEGDADGFLTQILPADGIELTFDTTIGLSSDEGVYFRGSGGLVVRLPVHIALGPISIIGATLAVTVPSTHTTDFGIDIDLGADIAADLSVLRASVENMGVRATFAFPDDGDGNIGPVDFSLGFKPPNGVGLAIDAGVVKGGGYLYLDYDKGEYAGALELVFSGFLAVKAIGIINTKMPDGSDGFSLVVIVTAEFGTPIQLGFGFTLIGLGGLLGLNRTMKLEEMAEGVRTGAIEGVMFPRDVIANAPRIISDLKRFFPAEEGTFLIGPMAKLGWGSPTLISASLGVIIEIPPGNIAILGVLKCALPDEDSALLVLQVKFIGALEVDKSRLWFFASLYGSRVLFMTLDGEMGLLVAWGNDANFVISVGGFHPRFTAPALPFPTPRRVGLSILDSSFARIRVEGYFAVTSNTVQFGARVELYFAVSAFSIEGHIAFDALFQFSPFYFIITFSASVSVKVFGAGLFSVRVRGELEGTSPWHVEGEGSISILFWSIDIPFSHTWGDSADTVLPKIAAMPILEAEVQKDANWQALSPPGSSLAVSLRTIDAETELVLHPVGELRIAQRAVPLDLTIEKVGNQAVSDVTNLTVDVQTGSLQVKRKVREPFATEQFRELTADQKLSAPGFEKQVAGVDVSIAGSETQTSHAVKREVRHELITIDSNYREHVKFFFGVIVTWFLQMLPGNATARSAKSQATYKAKVPFAEKIAATQPVFVVANLADNTAWDGASFATQAEAVDALATAGSIAGQLHVIPMAEAMVAT